MNQNDLQTEVRLNKIGPCPVCGKGRMLQGTAGWTCDYFHSLEDKCTFTIFSSYYGYELTEQDALDLITTGRTECKELTDRDGNPFRAILVREGSKIKAKSVPDSLPVPCPHCSGKIHENGNGYVCENYFKEGDEHCGFYLPKEVSGRAISYQEALTLAERGRTDVLDGFSSQGKTYSSCLVIGRDGTVLIDGRICRCPKCGGIVYAGIKGYNCSNYRNPSIQCRFVIWRTIGKRSITVEDVKMLCSQRKTGEMTFYTKDDVPYNKSLYLDEDCNVKMI